MPDQPVTPHPYAGFLTRDSMDFLKQQVFAHPFVTGLPEVTADIHSFGSMLAHTDEHVWMQPYQWDNIDYMMHITMVAAGGGDRLRVRP